MKDKKSNYFGKGEESRRLSFMKSKRRGDTRSRGNKGGGCWCGFERNRGHSKIACVNKLLRTCVARGVHFFQGFDDLVPLVRGRHERTNNDWHWIAQCNKFFADTRAYVGVLFSSVSFATGRVVSDLHGQGGTVGQARIARRKMFAE